MRSPHCPRTCPATVSQTGAVVHAGGNRTNHVVKSDYIVASFDYMKAEKPHVTMRLLGEAEGEGFEPSSDPRARNGFRDRRIRPLCHPSGGRHSVAGSGPDRADAVAEPVLFDSYAREVGKPPLAPYPPDPDDDVAPPTELGELVDVTIEGADWANTRPARGMQARRVELRSCRLTGAELVEARVSDVTFDECRLDLVNLRFANLERVVFRDCRMSECDLYEASVKDVLFERCELREATFSSAALQRVELRGCDLTGLRGVESLRGARMPWNDVLENAPLFATAVGIEIID